MNCAQFKPLIDRYIIGNLPEENLETFEAHYFECDQCFSLLKSVERLQSKEIQFPITTHKKRSIYIWKPILAFSSIVLIFLTTYLILHPLNRIRELYTISNFSTPAYLQSETRDGEEPNEKFSEAMKYYNIRDYRRALDLLKRVPDASQNPQIIFFEGICNLSIDKKEDAIKQFDAIISTMNSSYYDDALFYKAVALIRLNRKGEASIILKNLSDMFSPYSSRAITMFEKIRDSKN